MALQYVSVENATTYFATRLYTAEWTAASAGDKSNALYMAERLIESVPWRGQPYDFDESEQPIKWPRVIDGVSVDYDEEENEAVVPTEIKEAIYEEALAILKLGNSSRDQLRSDGVKSFNVGGMISETFTSSKDQSEVEELGFKSLEAYRMVKRWVYRGGPTY